MKVSRPFAGVLAGLVCVAPLAATATAQATEDLTTNSTLRFDVYVPLEVEGSFGGVPYKEGKPVSFGTEFEFRPGVLASDGSVPLHGGANVQIRTATQHQWTDHLVFSDWGEVGGYHYYTPQSSAEYRIVYSGYAAATESENSYAPSTSAPFFVNVSRAVKARTRGQRVMGEVSPGYKNRKVEVLLEDGKKYVPFTQVKTNQNSEFRVKLPGGKSRKQRHLRLYIPATAKFAATVKDRSLRY